MKIKRKSHFKNPAQDKPWFENWVSELEQANGRRYARLEVETSLGKTQIWGLNTENDDLETLVIFPGARTTALFWDFNRGWTTWTAGSKSTSWKPTVCPTGATATRPTFIRPATANGPQKSLTN
jgi:hypothetical protein